ncbi:MAG: serine protease [Gammaproteobacteria bacterium]|nr:serine protease [Gammaproteobacteria bacterium]
MTRKKSSSPLDDLTQAILDGDASGIDRAASELRAEPKSSPPDPKFLVKMVKELSAAGCDSLIAAIAGEYTARLRSDVLMYPQTFATEIARAANEFDKERVTELCSQFIQHQRTADKPFPLPIQNSILYELQRKRYFDLMLKVGDTLILRNGLTKKNDKVATKKDNLAVRRRYAQALIETGQLAAALTFLISLATEAEANQVPKELAEIQGLIGRTNKQYYMDAAAQSDGAKLGDAHRNALSDAIDAYGIVYDGDNSKTWHGINTAALIQRASRDKIRLKTIRKRSANRIAKNILKRIDGQDGPANLWDSATTAESNLVRGNYDQSLRRVIDYTNAAGADAFEYASTLRQFEEVWQLDDENAEHAKILQLLRAALLKKEGGEVEIHNLDQEVESAERISADANFETILGKDRYKTYRWYVQGLDRATAVAKIYDRAGNGVGTGFLVKGTVVHPSITQDWVFVTNAHVISNDPEEQNGSPRALPPEDAEIIFQAGTDANKKFGVEQLLFTSRRTDLDCTIVTLDKSLSFDKAFRVSKSLPPVGNKSDHRVYVIGHPKGAGLAFSLHDNLLLDHESPKVHYRAPTEGGSSGSPVFNSNWDLIALHHLGGKSVPKLNNKPGVYGANEGIFIQSILGAVARKLG